MLRTVEQLCDRDVLTHSSYPNAHFGRRADTPAGESESGKPLAAGVGPAAPGSDIFTVRILEGDDTEALVGPWRILHAMAKDVSAAQGPDFVLAAYRAARDSMSAPETELLAIYVETGGNLVGLWPVFRSVRDGRRWISPPGFGANEEFSGPIIHPSHGVEVCEALLKAGSDAADVLLFTLPATHPAASAARVLTFAHRHTVRSPAIALPGEPDFDKWMESKSASFRKGLRYNRRRLEKLGPVELFEGRTGNTKTLGMAAWIFEEKRSWAKARALPENWLFNGRGEALIQRALCTQNPQNDGVRVYALEVDGTPAAGAICLTSDKLFELVVFSMNPDHAIYSPGNLLLYELVKRSFAENREFDFRITREDYKLRWADTDHLYLTFVCSDRFAGLKAVAQAEWHTRKVAARQWARRQLNKMTAAAGTAEAHKRR